MQVQVLFASTAESTSIFGQVQVQVKVQILCPWKLQKVQVQVKVQILCPWKLQKVQVQVKVQILCPWKL